MASVQDHFVEFERHVLQDNILLAMPNPAFCWRLPVAFFCGAWKDRALLAPQEFLNTYYLSYTFLVLYSLAVPALLITAYWGWQTVRPRIRPTSDYIFWGSPIFRKSKQEFASSVRESEPEALMDSMLEHLHMLGAICREKYDNFGKAARAAEFASILFLAAEFFRLALSIVRIGGWERGAYAVNEP